MALRAGYKGVKNDMIAAIKSLASLGIKSLGTMFNVSNKGVLSVKNATASAAGIVKPDGVTITVDSGIISAAGGLSVTELYTGSASAAGEITLTDDYTDYKMIALNLKNNKAAVSITVPVSFIESLDSLETAPSPTYDNEHWFIENYTGAYIRLIRGTGNNKLYPFDFNGPVTVSKVYGIK